MDEYEALDTPLGEIHGMTLRLYDERARQWTIYWANRQSGKLDVPMTGAWVNGRGEFYNQEPFQGRMIYVRFIWTNDSPDTARGTGLLRRRRQNVGDELDHGVCESRVITRHSCVTPPGQAAAAEVDILILHIGGRS